VSRYERVTVVTVGFGSRVTRVTGYMCRSEAMSDT
jgi:hypothetical protein